MEVTLFNLLSLLLSLYGTMFLVKTKLKIDFYQAPFVSVTLLMMTLYISSLLGFLKEGAIIVFSLGLASSAWHLFSKARTYMRQKDKVIVLDKRYSPLWIFGVLFILNWVIFGNDYIYKWDEFSFWGYFSKIMTSYHEVIAEFNTINKADYPRASALFHYYFTLFLNQGNHKDGIIIFSQLSILFSAVPLFLPRVGRRKLVKTIIVCIAFYCMFHAILMPISLLYNDALLALFFACGILFYFINEEKGKALTIVALILFVCTQIKETGLVFSFCVIVVVGLDYFFFVKGKKWNKIKHILLVTLVVLCSKWSWDVFKYYNDVNNESFNLEISEILNWDLQDYQKQTAKNYLKSFFFIGDIEATRGNLKEGSEKRFIGEFGYPISFEDKVAALNKIFNSEWVRPGPDFLYDQFSLSPFFWVLFLMIFSIALYFFDRGSLEKIGFKEKKRLLLFAITLSLVFVGYVVLQSLLYMFSFIPWEAIRLASFGRYLGTMVLGICLILFYFIAQSSNRIIMLSFVGVILFCTPGEAIENLAPKHTRDTQTYLGELYNELDPLFEVIKKEDPRGKVFLVNQKSSGGFYVCFRYRAFPLRVDGWWSFNTEKKKGWRSDTQIVSPKEFEQLLKEKDFLVIWNNMDFWELYAESVKNANLKGVWRQENRKFIKVDNSYIAKKVEENKVR